jgi:hypothetical protein
VAPIGGGERGRRRAGPRPVEVGSLACVSHIRPGDRLGVRGADEVEGRVLRVDRDGLLVEWAGRLGALRHPWSEVGARFVRLPRLAPGEGERRRAG